MAFSSEEKISRMKTREIPVPRDDGDVQDRYDSFIGLRKAAEFFDAQHRSKLRPTIRSTPTSSNPRIIVEGMQLSSRRGASQSPVNFNRRSKSLDDAVNAPGRGGVGGRRGEGGTEEGGRKEARRPPRVATISSVVRKWRRREEKEVRRNTGVDDEKSGDERVGKAAAKSSSTSSSSSKSSSISSRSRRKLFLGLGEEGAGCANGYVAQVCSHWRLQSSEEQSKMTKSRVRIVDEHFAALCHSFGGISRSLGKLRDGGDGLARALANFARAETVNVSTSETLRLLAKDLATMEDHREMLIRRIAALVVRPLQIYEDVCRKAKEDLQDHVMILHREKSKYQHLQSIRDKNPLNKPLILEAREELRQATTNTWEIETLMADDLIDFETRKLHDLKSTLGDFFGASLAFHAKSIELLTKATNDLKTLDVDADVAEVEQLVFWPLSGTPGRRIRREGENAEKGNSSTLRSRGDGRLSRSAPLLTATTAISKTAATKTFSTPGETRRREKEEEEEEGRKAKSVSWDSFYPRKKGTIGKGEERELEEDQDEDEEEEEEDVESSQDTYPSHR